MQQAQFLGGSMISVEANSFKQARTVAIKELLLSPKITGDSKVILEEKAAFHVKNAQSTYGRLNYSVLKKEKKYYSDLLKNKNMLNNIIEYFRKNPSSRRGVFSFWKTSDRLLNGDSNCLVYIHFRKVNEKVEMCSHFRANDCYLHLPVDFAMCNHIHKIVSKKLGIPMGGYYHFVDALQIYISDLKNVRSMVERWK